MLESREAAARQLAGRLARYAPAHPLVLAIPRGAVPMARILSHELDGDLDVVLVHKLGSPWSLEYAIGAVDEHGHVEQTDPNVDEEHVRRETARQLEALRGRRASYGAESPSNDPKGRTVIVVDDGVATGATMIAALRSVRARGPARLIAAVGVAPSDTVARLRREADEVVVLATPADFRAVGQFYAHFPQVTDEEVVGHLRARARSRSAVRSADVES